MFVDLMTALRTDEEREAFEDFYRSYEKLMFKAARQILDDQQDCEDAVQSACAYIIDRFEKFSLYSPRQTASYIVLLIRNRSRDIRDRRIKYSHEDIQNCEEMLPSGAEEVYNDALESAFFRLPERYKEALTLRYYNALSVRETAAALGISESAAKKLLQRARDLLRDSMIAVKGGDDE